MAGVTALACVLLVGIPVGNGGAFLEYWYCFSLSLVVHSVAAGAVMVEAAMVEAPEEEQGVPAQLLAPIP